jgi:phosphate transport system protein
MNIRAAFHKQLREIQNEILVMGNMVSKALLFSIEALENGDMELARQIIVEDQKVNSKRFEIEEKCTQLIATQQPLAGDLRILIAVLYITTEIERIGDYATNIARKALLIGDKAASITPNGFTQLKEQVISMYHRSLEAFRNQDAKAAMKIGSEDDLVDNLYEQSFNNLLISMRENPNSITDATCIIRSIHNLERAADRVTNICERVVFIINGKMEEIGAAL